MAFEFTSALANMRKIVHVTMGHPAVYRATRTSAPVGITVRWHDKLVMQGDLANQGFSQVLEGVDRVIFNREELAQKNVVLHFGGTVTLGPSWDNAVLNLEALEPSHGPGDVIWKVSR